MNAAVIETLPADADPARAATILEESGVLVLRGVAGLRERDAILAELGAHFEGAPVAPDVPDDSFYPGHTRRVTALIAKSAGVRALVTNPGTRALWERLLLPNCERVQLHVASALVVGPGARSQVLHREDDVYPFFPLPRPNLVVATMWALTPFTPDNGATLVVPGSHLWPAERKPAADEVVSAEMEAGSVLFWLGGVLHGAGANRSDDWRHGVFLSYSLGWLRQEENQFLDVPPVLAATLDPELRVLVGYTMHGGLGFWDRGAGPAGGA